MYEVMLNHSLGRWSSEMDLLHKEGNDVEVVYLCNNQFDADAIAKEFSRNTQSLKNGKWLGYTHRLVVRHTVPDDVTSHKRWLRRQFFIGIAYHCDIDGLQRVKVNRNS